MKKPVIAVIGGSQESTFKKIGSKNGCKVLFHDGKVRNGGNPRDFRPYVKKADVVVVILGAISHITMKVVRDLCKETGTPIVFQDGLGASGAIQSGLKAVSLPLAG